ncbi:hypothetical protein EJB05_24346, partial [Eragrostis curvula]
MTSGPHLSAREEREMGCGAGPRGTGPEGCYTKASWPDHRLKDAMIIMFLSGCIKYAERTFCLFLSNPLGQRLLAMGQLSNALQKMKATQGEEGNHTKGEVEFARRVMVETLDKMLKGCWSWGGADVAVDIMSEDAPHSMLTEFKFRAGRCGAYNTGAFHGRRKGGRLDDTIIRADIAVSYVLLVGAVVLDACSFFSSLGYLLTDGWTRNAIFCVLNYIKPARSRKQWSEELAQYSIIKSCTPKSSLCKTLAACLFVVRGSGWVGPLLGLLVAWLFGKTHVPITEKHTPMKEFILDYLLCLGSRKEWDVTSSRGKLALQKWMGSHQDTNSATRIGEALGRSINVDFPISVLIWHIATDMCYYCGDDSTTRTDQMNKDNKQVSRELSNYILYLVFKCGVKRTTGSQVVRYRACCEIRDLLFKKGGQQVNLDDDKDVVKELFDCKEEAQQDSTVIKVQKLQELRDEQDSTVTEIQEPQALDEEQLDSSVVTIEFQKPTRQATNKMQKLVQSTVEALDSPVLPRARELARELLGIKDAAERWRLIVRWSTYNIQKLTSPTEVPILKPKSFFSGEGASSRSTRAPPPRTPPPLATAADALLLLALLVLLPAALPGAPASLLRAAIAAHLSPASYGRGCGIAWPPALP